MTKPGHIFSERKTQMAKMVHLSEDYLRGYLLRKPFNISLIGKSISISLYKGNWQTNVFQRNSWWFALAVNYLILIWSIVKLREVFCNYVLSKISEILKRWSCRKIWQKFWKSVPVIIFNIWIRNGWYYTFTESQKFLAN